MIDQNSETILKQELPDELMMGLSISTVTKVLTGTSVKERIYELEGIIKKVPQVAVQVEHAFAQGLYLRKVLIPKGCWMTGRIHKQDDMQIVVYGDIEMITEDGTYRRCRTGDVFAGKAGMKPFGIAHEDTLWVTVFATKLTDLLEIEATLFEDESGGMPYPTDFVTGRASKEELPCQQC